MDVTIYLPDALGREAKRRKLNVSRLARNAIIDEIERQDVEAEEERKQRAIIGWP